MSDEAGALWLRRFNELVDKVNQMTKKAIAEKDISEWESERGKGMQSALGEYTPSEFWEAVDEIKRLRTGYMKILMASDGEMGDGDLARNVAQEMLGVIDTDAWIKNHPLEINPLKYGNSSESKEERENRLIQAIKDAPTVDGYVAPPKIRPGDIQVLMYMGWPASGTTVKDRDDFLAGIENNHG